MVKTKPLAEETRIKIRKNIDLKKEMDILPSHMGTYLADLGLDQEAGAPAVKPRSDQIVTRPVKDMYQMTGDQIGLDNINQGAEARVVRVGTNHKEEVKVVTNGTDHVTVAQVVKDDKILVVAVLVEIAIIDPDVGVLVEIAVIRQAVAVIAKISVIQIVAVALAEIAIIDHVVEVVVVRGGKDHANVVVALINSTSLFTGVPV